MPKKKDTKGRLSCLKYSKYIPDAFEAQHTELEAQRAQGAHPKDKADYLPATPPFSDCDWRSDLLQDDPRWAHGTPPAGKGSSCPISVRRKPAA